MSLSSWTDLCRHLADQVGNYGPQELRNATDDDGYSGMRPDLEGPFFSHTAGYSLSKMTDAIEHLHSTIEEFGPFEGVLGFSQGAAVALSYMYQEQVSMKEAPFKFALCFSSVMPFSADADCCKNVIQRLCSSQYNPLAALSPHEPDLSNDERLFRDLVRRTLVAAQEEGQALPEPTDDLKIFAAGNDAEAPRMMHPQLLKEKLRIPTVHVTGKRDFDCMRNMSNAAYALCDARMSKKLEHNGGHQPPQKDAEVKAAVRAMEWAIGQASRQVANPRL